MTRNFDPAFRPSTVRRRIGVIAVCVATAAMVIGVSGPASAQTTRISQGDALAALRAFNTGGWAVRLHSKEGYSVYGNASGPSVVSAASIRPFSGSPWDGAHFCTLDWHTLVMADVEGGDKTFSRTEAELITSRVEIRLSLDGVPLVTTRTPVQRFLAPENFGVEEAYFFQTGRVLAPGEMSLGPHVFSVSGSYLGEGFSDAITIFIDAAGTGACV